MKRMSLPVAVAVAIIGCVLAVSANVTTGNIHGDLQKERYYRIMVEKKLQTAEKTIADLQREWNDAQSKIDSIEKILNKGQVTASDLRGQLDAVMQERQNLIQKLNELQSQADKSLQQPSQADQP